MNLDDELSYQRWLASLEAGLDEELAAHGKDDCLARWRKHIEDSHKWENQCAPLNWQAEAAAKERYIKRKGWQ